MRIIVHREIGMGHLFDAYNASARVTIDCVVHKTEEKQEMTAFYLTQTGPGVRGAFHSQDQ